MPDEKPKQGPSLTTEAGAPVADNQHSQTAGPGGPVLLQDQHLLEKLARFNRERIPERVVHAAGSARLRPLRGDPRRDPLDPGALPRRRWASAPRSSCASRRWPAIEGCAGHRARSARLRDEVLHRGRQLRPGRQQHADLLHPRPAQVPRLHPLAEARSRTRTARSPTTSGTSSRLSPEATHSSPGSSATAAFPPRYRHMDGFGSHTFQWVNAAGERVLGEVPLQDRPGHPLPHRGGGRAHRPARIPSTTSATCVRAIERGELPVVDAQGADHAGGRGARDYRFNPFDLTKVWPYEDYPLIEVGKLVLDRNPDNYFAEVEQAAFDPGHFVPGHRPVARQDAAGPPLRLRRRPPLPRSASTTRSCR